MRDEENLKQNSIVCTLALDICIDDFINNEVDQELKDKAIEAYKNLEEQKTKENQKYHIYQY